MVHRIQTTEATNVITFDFPVMHGEFPPWRAVIETIDRPGVNNFLRRLRNFNSETFVITTFSNFVDYAEGEMALESAKTLIMRAPVRIIKDDFVYDNSPPTGWGCRAAILDVEKTRGKMMHCISASPTLPYELVLKWTARWVA